MTHASESNNIHDGQGCSHPTIWDILDPLAGQDAISLYFVFHFYPS